MKFPTIRLEVAILAAVQALDAGSWQYEWSPCWTYLSLVAFVLPFTLGVSLPLLFPLDFPLFFPFSNQSISIGAKQYYLRIDWSFDGTLGQNAQLRVNLACLETKRL